MRGRDPVILERDKELATLAAAIAGASTGHGTFVLVEGPAGIGKTTLLRAACQRPAAAEAQVLTGRGLALERDFPYGIVRQLIEPVRVAATPQEWAGLLDGAAGSSTGPGPPRSRTTRPTRSPTACTGWPRTWRRAARW
jgi:hypothetical protein